jgi:hypothetical protein
MTPTVSQTPARGKCSSAVSRRLQKPRPILEVLESRITQILTLVSSCFSFLSFFFSDFGVRVRSTTHSFSVLEMGEYRFLSSTEYVHIIVHIPYGYVTIYHRVCNPLSKGITK